MSLNLFDKVAYINLKHRKDRKRQILSELDKLKVEKDKIVRIDAEYVPLNGHLGCALSHIKALELAEKSKFKNLLILEDDAEFIVDKKKADDYVESFFNTVKNEWDVFFLGGTLRVINKTDYPNINRVIISVDAHAYAINNHYFSTLKNLYLEALESLKPILCHTYVQHEAIDQKWHSLQAKDRWYMKDELIAIQRNSFSDIEQAL
ncbi:MAG: glycosyltransferase family 25 protein [Chlamydiae bacterium]|nr:glycosyltransferase family 25 protein [Chlamydiota bacterium]